MEDELEQEALFELQGPDDDGCDEGSEPGEEGCVGVAAEAGAESPERVRENVLAGVEHGGGTDRAQASGMTPGKNPGRDSGNEGNHAAPKDDPAAQYTHARQRPVRGLTHGYEPADSAILSMPATARKSREVLRPTDALSR